MLRVCNRQKTNSKFKLLHVRNYFKLCAFIYTYVHYTCIYSVVFSRFYLFASYWNGCCLRVPRVAIVSVFGTPPSTRSCAYDVPKKENWRKKNICGVFDIFLRPEHRVRGHNTINYYTFVYSPFHSLQTWNFITLHSSQTLRPKSGNSDIKIREKRQFLQPNYYS